MSTQNIRFFDMFAGIGGFRAGLERAGGFTCIGHCEIDKHAEKAYQAIHNIKESEVYYEDARKIDTGAMPDFDLLCAGFPCQSFSIAGKRRGFEDARGTLFFEIARVLKAKQPAFFILENVPGLLSHDEGRTFTTILSTLSELGYGVEGRCLTASILESHSHAGGCILPDILIRDVPEKYYLSPEQTEKLLYRSSAGHRGKGSTTRPGSPAPSSPAPGEAAEKPGCTS